MNKKQQLTNCIEYVNLQKRYRNERLDPMEWEYYQESYKENEMEIIKPTKSKLTVQNKEMLSLFEQGGIEAIMEQMDANEIYKNQEDAEALGIIKPTKR